MDESTTEEEVNSLSRSPATPWPGNGSFLKDPDTRDTVSPDPTGGP